MVGRQSICRKDSGVKAHRARSLGNYRERLADSFRERRRRGHFLTQPPGELVEDRLRTDFDV